MYIYPVRSCTSLTDFELGSVCARACVHALGTRVTSCGKRKQVADDKQTLAGEFFLLLPITL